MSVKRILLTSLAAVREEDATPREYDEMSWNKATIAVVTSRGSVAEPIAIYSTSKTLAEHAARKFVAGHKVKLAWDLVVCNPPWIFDVADLSRTMVLDPCRVAPRTLVSQPRADGRRPQRVPERNRRYALVCTERGAAKGNWVHVSVTTDVHHLEAAACVCHLKWEIVGGLGS